MAAHSNGGAVHTSLRVLDACCALIPLVAAALLMWPSVPRCLNHRGDASRPCDVLGPRLAGRRRGGGARVYPAAGLRVLGAHAGMRVCHCA